jgi:hypothetical protein
MPIAALTTANANPRRTPLTVIRRRPSASRSTYLRGTVVLISLDDVRLDTAIASLPGSEIHVHFTARLRFIRRARDAHDELVRASTFGGAASLPQELLQADELIGVADVDVQAAVALGSGRNRVAYSLSSRTPACQEPVMSSATFWVGSRRQFPAREEIRGAQNCGS